jgi:hypothetical protein
MSGFTPNPDANPEGENSPLNGFDFSALNAETVSPEDAPPQFEAPQKPKWWESKRRRAKTIEERKALRKNKPMPKAPQGGLRRPLEDMYTGLGMMLMPFDPSCGKVIIDAAPRCAETLDELAKTNPAVRRILISLVTTSALGAVIMAHAPILMAIAMHHVPALRDRQEKMVGEFAEMMANGFTMGEENPEGE